MGKIVIKKRIALDMLGEDYKDSYLEFESIPFSDMGTLAKKSDEIAKADEKDKNFGSFEFIKTELGERFVSGKVQDQDVDKDNLFDLPAEVLIDCFQQLMGKISPK